jgi:hypothetical protein
VNKHLVEVQKYSIGACVCLDEALHTHTTHPAMAARILTLDLTVPCVLADLNTSCVEDVCATTSTSPRESFRLTEACGGENGTIANPAAADHPLQQVVHGRQ